MPVLSFAGASGRECFAGRAGCFQIMGWARNCSATAAALASAPAYAIALAALTMELGCWVSSSVLFFALPMVWIDIPAIAAYPIAMISPAISTMLLSAMSVGWMVHLSSW